MNQINLFKQAVDATPRPEDVMPHGSSPKSIGFFTKEQSHELAEVTLASLRAGDSPGQIEAKIKAWLLEELPEGLLAKHGWQAEALAEMLTIAALLAAICVKRRRQFGSQELN